MRQVPGALLDPAFSRSYESVKGFDARRGWWVWSVSSVWFVLLPDRETNHKNQRDQIDLTNKTDETYAALEAAFSKSS